MKPTITMLLEDYENLKGEASKANEEAVIIKNAVKLVYAVEIDKFLENARYIEDNNNRVRAVELLKKEGYI